MNIEKFKQIFPDSLQPEKIGKYHYIFNTNFRLVQKNKHFYYEIIPTNLEKEILSPVVDYIPIDVLMQSKEAAQIGIAKVKNNLKLKLLKLQKGVK